MYELGVLDNGTLVGLTRLEMEETLETLGRMLATFGGGEIRVSRVLRVGGSAEATSATDGSDSSDGDTRRRPSFSALFPSFHVDPAVDPDSYLPPLDDGESTSSSSHSKPFRPTHPHPPLSTLVLPIAIKRAPHPERTPEERAQLKRQKRDVRRAKRQEENDWIPPVRYRPPPGHRAPRPPHLAPSTPAGGTGVGQPKQQGQQKRKSPSAKTLAKLAAMPAECPFKPRAASAEGEEKFVVEAVVIKRSQGVSGGRTSSSEERGGVGTGSEEDSVAVEESEDDVPVDEDVLDGEGWRYIDFDSLPRIRGGSMSSLGA